MDITYVHIFQLLIIQFFILCYYNTLFYHAYTFYNIKINRNTKFIICA